MDLHSRKTSSTPKDFARHLKDRGPLFWSEPEQFWVITDHALAQEALKIRASVPIVDLILCQKCRAAPFLKW